MFEHPEQANKPKKPRIAGKRTIINIEPERQNKINITEEIIHEVASIASEYGTELYIVGGYVRDYYLKRKRSDFDFTVVGDAIDFAKKVASHFNSKTVEFKSFRTAMVPVGDFKLEFVGTRKEFYNPNSRKPIVVEGTLVDDLTRRDFTINTLAVSLAKNNFGEVTDLFNGYNDITHKIIRTPLEPATTYNDDPLRMVRAARFSSQLDFVLDTYSFEAARRMSERITIVSQERITDEFIKIMASQKPSKGLLLLHQMGLLKYIFPELENLSGVETINENGRDFAHKDIFMHTIQVVDNISRNTDNIWLRFAALVHDIAKPKTKRFTSDIGWTFHGHEEMGARWMEGIFRRLKLPLEHLDYVRKLVRLHQRPMALVDGDVTDSAVRRLAFQAGDALEDLFTLCRADITTNNPKLSIEYLNNYNIVFKKVLEVQEKDKLREFQSPVKGDEIMEICNIQPSPLVGYIKNLIEEAILDGIIPNEYDAAKWYFLENMDSWLEKYTEENKELNS